MTQLRTVGTVLLVTAFPVPSYLAETARRHGEVATWLAGLPSIVAELADRWSLRVGEPFQPGGQCVQESVGWPLMRQVAAHLAPA